jgi:transcriptional regulator with XRE-family HTH domain
MENKFEIDEVGLRVRAARKRTGLSQVQLGLALGLDKSQISKIEKGKRRLDIGEVADAAICLGTTTRELLGMGERSKLDLAARLAGASLAGGGNVTAWIPPSVRVVYWTRPLTREAFYVTTSSPFIGPSIKKSWTRGFNEWQHRGLSSLHSTYLYADGIYQVGSLVYLGADFSSPSLAPQEDFTGKHPLRGETLLPADRRALKEQRHSVAQRV